MKFLNEMKDIIPFEHLVSILIEEGIYKPEVGLKDRRNIDTCKDAIRSIVLAELV